MLNPAELGIAIVCTEDGFEKLQAGECPVLGEYLAWGAEKRPRSAKPQVMEWKLEISKMKAAVDFVPASEVSSREMPIGECVLQGQLLQLRLQLDLIISTEGDSSGSKQRDVMT